MIIRVYYVSLHLELTTHIMETKTDTTYLANDVTPVYQVHPGTILGEELKARGISQKSFAKSVGLQATHISALIHGTRNFTAAVAEKIASGLDGISADLWVKLQERYNTDTYRKRIRTSSLVAGYNYNNLERQPAYLAESQASYGGHLQINLTIPEEDKELLETLANRFGWIYQKI